MTAVPGPAPEKYAPRPRTRITHPGWAASAAIYQLNTRQFTAEGTLRAAQAHLPRLRDLGVDIVWLMPIHPIGEVQPQGHARQPVRRQGLPRREPRVRHPRGPAAFVAAAHELGLHVILDWVANHTAWDNPLVGEHPEWYRRDWNGRLLADAVVGLGRHHRPRLPSPALRRYMTEAMTYWVREADVDGFRCDVAGFVPVDFWETARGRAGADQAGVHARRVGVARPARRAFDMTYAGTGTNRCTGSATGTPTLGARGLLLVEREGLPPRRHADDVRRPTTTRTRGRAPSTSSSATALEAAIVLSVVGEGMPLVYNGQEAGYDRRLEFFERDPIEWRPHPMGDLYRASVHTQKENRGAVERPWGRTDGRGGERHAGGRCWASSGGTRPATRSSPSSTSARRSGSRPCTAAGTTAPGATRALARRSSWTAAPGSGCRPGGTASSSRTGRPDARRHGSTRAQPVAAPMPLAANQSAIACS